MVKKFDIPDSLFHISVRHDKKYLRFGYDESQINSPFWGLKLLFGKFTPAHPIELRRDITFGIEKSELLPTNLHIYYVISFKLIEAFNEADIKGFGTYPLISRDNSFHPNEYFGITVTGRVKGKFVGPLMPLVLESNPVGIDIMLLEEGGLTSGTTIINNRVLEVLNKFSIPNIEIREVIITGRE